MSSRDLADQLIEALRSPAPPVPVRAVIAGTLMCSRGGAPTRLGMSKVGDYSYGSSQNHYSNLLDAIVEDLPAIIERMEVDDIDPVSAAQLREDLRQRDQTIAALRAELRQLNDAHGEVKRYALALHEQLREADEQLAAERGKSVRALRPLQS